MKRFEVRYDEWFMRDLRVVVEANDKAHALEVAKSKLAWNKEIRPESWVVTKKLQK